MAPAGTTESETHATHESCNGATGGDDGTMQLAPTTPGLARSIVRIGPCTHWSEVNALLESLRTLPELAALDVVGIQDGLITLDVCCPTTLPLHDLIAGSLPASCMVSVRPTAEEAPTAGAPIHASANGAAPGAPIAIDGDKESAGIDVRGGVWSGNGHGMTVVPQGATDGAGAHANGVRPASGLFDGTGVKEQRQPAVAGATRVAVVEELQGADPDANGAPHREDAQRPSRKAPAPAVGARLLIALDGSRLAEEALGYVAAHFDPRTTEVHLMSVVDQAEAAAMRVSIERSPAASYRRLYLRACAQDLQGFHVRCVVAAHDVPAEALSAYADRNAIDLLVMTAHGHSRQAGVPLGSVAEGVVAMRRLPVLVLPGGARAPSDQRPA
jgi:nucleotide-binding universal stress UspA family protein